MEIEVLQKPTTWEAYEARFKEILVHLRERGIEAGIFGDIDMLEHRKWVERVCRETGIIPVMPLWQWDREALMEEFINAGFKAVVVATDARVLGREWLGREISPLFREELRNMTGVDLCGEKGEYHTFVYDGPMFKGPVSFFPGESIKTDSHWFFTLTEAAL
jgi:diphthine-ammonia ligase